MQPTQGQSAAGAKASAAGAAGQRISMCRMVVYHDHGHPTPQEWPAVCLQVNADGSAMLTVFKAQGPMQVSRSTEGSALGCWSWPPRETPLVQPAS